MQQNSNVFNSTINGRHVTRRPRELPAHTIRPSENAHDLALGAHDVLVGVVEQHSSGHPHRELYHSTAPFKKVFSEGERPQSDMVFESIRPDPLAEPMIMESNHVANLRFYSVYDDGTSRLALPSDDRLNQEKRRMEEDIVVGALVKRIQQAYGLESGTQLMKQKAIDSVISVQRGLNINNPELSQYLGSVLSTYQNNALLTIRQAPQDKVFVEKRAEALEAEKKEVTKGVSVKDKIAAIDKKKAPEDEIVEEDDKMSAEDADRLVLLDKTNKELEAILKGVKGVKRKNKKWLVNKIIELGIWWG